VDALAPSVQDGPADAELIALMKQHGTRYSPSLAVYLPERVDGSGKARAGTEAYRQREANFANALRNVKTLHDAGIPIVLGTDAGMTGTPHGASTLRELELFVQAGLTPTEALLAGTRASAEALALDDRGSIEVGKRADLLLVMGKPWERIGDIRNTQQVYVVGRQVVGKGVQLRFGSPSDLTLKMQVVERVLKRITGAQRHELSYLDVSAPSRPALVFHGTSPSTTT
jgi:imidazolonepropionase-like amidohydrolase